MSTLTDRGDVVALERAAIQSRRHQLEPSSDEEYGVAALCRAEVDRAADHYHRRLRTGFWPDFAALLPDDVRAEVRVYGPLTAIHAAAEAA